ncbi:MAG: hypothetical protein Q9203_006595 [Teloschistes exilis]
MRQPGLRPTPQPEEDFEDSDSACHEYAAKVLREDTTPIRLLTLNKKRPRCSTKKPTLHIDITPEYVRFLNAKIEMRRFPSHQSLTELALFTRMQHYHLDIKIMKLRRKPERFILNATETIKESIRLVADALSHNNTIKTLTVAVPYYCVPNIYYGSGWVTSDIYKLLNPLTRLRLDSPIRIVSSDEIGPAANYSNKPRKCFNPVIYIEGNLTLPQNLDGQPLSERESRWRDLKMIPRPPGTLIDQIFPESVGIWRGFHKVRVLVGGKDSWGKFDEAAEKLRISIEKLWDLKEASEKKERGWCQIL